MSSKAGGESTPLLGADHRRTTSNSSYYFLQQNPGVESSGDDAATIRSGVTAVHENIPAGSQPDDFDPKKLTSNAKVCKEDDRKKTMPAAGFLLPVTHLILPRFPTSTHL